MNHTNRFIGKINIDSDECSGYLYPYRWSDIIEAIQVVFKDKPLPMIEICWHYPKDDKNRIKTRSWFYYGVWGRRPNSTNPAPTDYLCRNPQKLKSSNVMSDAYLVGLTGMMKDQMGLPEGLKISEHHLFKALKKISRETDDGSSLAQFMELIGCKVIFKNKQVDYDLPEFFTDHRQYFYN